MWRLILFILSLLTFSSMSYAQATTSAPALSTTPASCANGTCVPPSDMAVFLEALQEKKCLTTTPPVVSGDAVQIIVDKEGRVYGSGSGPKPYTLHINWCNYQLTAQGQTTIVASQAPVQTIGFRFRPKAVIGILGTELATGSTFQNAVDAGALVEPFYFLTNWNLNAYVGVRSVGAGVGYDLVNNIGAYLGYAMTWGQWRSNPVAALYFSIW